MASVSERGGKLYFDFRLQGHRCREYTSLPDTAPNRRKMESVLQKIETDIAFNRFDYARYFPGSANVARFAEREAGPPLPETPVPDTPLYRDFVPVWVQEREVGWRHSYRNAVDSILQGHLLPAFGDIPVGEIDRPMLMQFRARLAAKRIRATKDSEGHPPSPATINRIMGIQRQILDEAAMRFGFSNPALTVKRLKGRRVDIEPFTMEEVRKLIATARKDYQPYFTVRFFTGMRSGEVHGLKWKHVDFDRGEILVRETYSGGRTEYTKTDGSQREIRMSQPVVDALRQQRPRLADPEGYVFNTRPGKPIDNTNFNDRIWQPLLRHLGLRRRRPYQMRHTCATLWLAAGENPEWIARQLGHTTTEMLFRVYSRYVPNLTRQDGTAFNSLVSAALNGGITQDEDAKAASTNSGRSVARGRNGGTLDQTLPIGATHA